MKHTSCFLTLFADSSSFSTTIFLILLLSLFQAVVTSLCPLEAHLIKYSGAKESPHGNHPPLPLTERRENLKEPATSSLPKSVLNLRPSIVSDSISGEAGSSWTEEIPSEDIDYLRGQNAGEACLSDMVMGDVLELLAATQVHVSRLKPPT